MGWSNYYLTTATTKQKVKILVNFFRTRHGAGLRGKQATEAGAAVRKYFSVRLLDTAWMDDPGVKLARRSCMRTPAENRAYFRSGAAHDKKPIWYDLLEQIRTDHWEGKEYDYRTADSTA
jgi:hypothetical protein